MIDLLNIEFTMGGRGKLGTLACPFLASRPYAMILYRFNALSRTPGVRSTT